MRTLAGRVDILRALIDGSPADIATMAETFGYVVRAPAPLPEPELPTPEPGLIPQVEAAPMKIVPPQVPKSAFEPVPFWRCTERTRIADPKDGSRRRETVINIPETDYKKLESDPPSPKILTRTALRRKLRGLLSVPRIGSMPDLARITRLFARGAVIRRVPRRITRGFPQSVHVWIDRSEHLKPVWMDQEAVIAELERMLGKLHCPVRCYSDGPRSLPLERGRKPPGIARSRSILILSDLGGYGFHRVRTDWADLIRRHVGSRASVAALVPLPKAYWRADLAHRVKKAAWEDPFPEPSAEFANLSVVERARLLLGLASHAVFLQPGLLRDIRHVVRELGVDLAIEIFAWDQMAKPLLIGGELSPEDRQKLQSDLIERLKVDRAKFIELSRRVQDVIDTWRKSDPAWVRLEETLALVGIASNSASKVVASDDKRKAAEKTLVRMAAALEFPDLVDPKVMEAMRSYLTTAETRLAPSINACDPLNDEFRRVLDLARRDASLASPHDRTLVRRKGTLLLLDRALDGDEHLASMTTRRLSAIATTSKDGRATASRITSKEGWTPIDRHFSELRVQSDFDRLSIESFTRPTWAMSVGVDERGLWCEAGEGWESVRFRWEPPRSPQLVDSTERGRWKLDPVASHSWAANIGVDVHGVFADVAVVKSSGVGGLLGKALRSILPGRTTSPEPRVVQRFRWIPPGEFLMGSPESEVGRFSKEVQHEVELTRGYWMADTPCTQAFYEAVMGTNPSIRKGDDRPVENVSWNDAVAMIEKLNRLCPGLDARLPTEAEWEYACRAGDGRATYAGDLTGDAEGDGAVLDRIAWYGGNRAGEATRPVRQKEANAWGLYDTLGNVYEWCADWYGAYSEDRVVDPHGPEESAYRVSRGGSWFSDARRVRAADRGVWGWGDPGHRGDDLGFRLARGQRIELPAAEPKKKKTRKAKRKGTPEAY